MQKKLIRKMLILILAFMMVLGTATMAFADTEDDLNGAVSQVTNTVLMGKNRYETCVRIAEEVYPDGAEGVIIVTGEKFPDALCGNAYAGALNIPILLSRLDSIPDGVYSLMESWKNLKNAYIIGGGFSSAVISKLKGLGVSVHNIAGANRYKTAEELLSRGMNEGSFTNEACVIATGKTPADALSMSAWCCRYHIPMLLADESGNLSSSSAAMLKQYGFRKVIIAGGTNVVKTETVTGAGISSSIITRLSGPTRWETSQAIADYFVNTYKGGTQNYNGSCFACGNDRSFPDALVGGMLAGNAGAPVLLINDTSESAYSYISSKIRNAADQVYTLGACGSDTMKAKIDKALKRTMETSITTPAHTHTWVAVTTTVHHDAETTTKWVEDKAAYDETVVVKAAYDEEVTVHHYEVHTICNECGFDFTANKYTQEQVDEHCGAHALAGDANYGHHTVQVDYPTTETIRHDAETKTVHHDAVGHYETFETKAAYDETVVTGYKCSCGATKAA